MMEYEYDALGQLISQEDGEGNVFTMTYDDLGRLTQKSGPDGDYDYTYDSYLKGLLYDASSPYQTSTSYNYDSFGRLAMMSEDVQGNQYEFNYDYDQYSNLQSIQYPNDLIIEYTYDAQGRVTEIKKADDQQLIWGYEDVNVMGQITEFDLGPNTTVNRTYDGTSWMLESYVNPGLAEYYYAFDYGTGNLDNRSNNTYGLEESFGYDELDRLETQTFSSSGQYLPSGASEINMTYSGDGSIESKTDVGTYSNEGGQTHQIKDNPNTISNDQQVITYTPFNSVSTIMEGPFDAAFVYGSDNQRRKMKIENAGQTYVERYYLAGGSYERDYRNGVWRNLVYVTTPTGQNAVYINDEGQHNHELYLLDLDHLGSIVGISDANGNLIEEYSYDPWGNRRDPQTWENEYHPGQSSNLWGGLLSRGYTGHEHLDCFGLINMNGRVYDPLLGRMLSPDNYVQNVTSTQNMNRFSYVLNNPLKYTDPSGELLLDAFVNGFFKGLVNTGSLNGAWEQGAQQFENEGRLLVGLFKTDHYNRDGSKASDWDAFVQLVSRFTYQAPQTAIGFHSGHYTNQILTIENVSFYDEGGVTVSRIDGNWGGITLGNYIYGDSDIRADPNNPLFQHEYGHYLQSRGMGPAYLSAVGIPSVLDNTENFHDFHAVEQDANRLAFDYFNRSVDGFYESPATYNALDGRGWDFTINPFDNTRPWTTGQYIDWKTADLDAIAYKPGWYNYLFPLGGGLWSAIDNAFWF